MLAGLSTNDPLRDVALLLQKPFTESDAGRLLDPVATPTAVVLFLKIRIETASALVLDVIVLTMIKMRLDADVGVIDADNPVIRIAHSF